MPDGCAGLYDDVVPLPVEEGLSTVELTCEVILPATEVVFDGKGTGVGETSELMVGKETVEFTELP